MSSNLQIQHKENETYKLEPVEGEDAWKVRILEGLYNETVLRFGSIAFNEIDENMSFNFHVEESPDASLTEDDEDLQIFAGDILQEIIRSAIESDDGSLMLVERDNK